MAAGHFDFTIEQGATFELDLVWKDSTLHAINLTGYTARMQVRDTVGSSTVLIELTTSNSRIVLGTTNGLIQLKITAADTTAISWDRGVYDLELVSGSGIVTRLLKGTVTIDKEVTR